MPAFLRTQFRNPQKYLVTRIYYIYIYMYSILPSINEYSPLFIFTLPPLTFFMMVTSNVAKNLIFGEFKCFTYIEIHTLKD